MKLRFWVQGLLSILIEQGGIVRFIKDVHVLAQLYLACARSKIHNTMILASITLHTEKHLHTFHHVNSIEKQASIGQHNLSKPTSLLGDQGDWSLLPIFLSVDFLTFHSAKALLRLCSHQILQLRSPLTVLCLCLAGIQCLLAPLDL